LSSISATLFIYEKKAYNQGEAGVKRILFYILPFIITACTASPTTAMYTPSESAFERTKLFAITAEAETQTSGYPANDLTITAIMGNKFAGGTAAAASMTAQPSETPTPTIPPDSPFCQPGNLKTSFASMGATQNILLGAGLKNVSSTPCYLQAWPQAMLIDRQGKPLDVEYHYFETGPAEDAPVATEQARESATAKIGIWPGWVGWVNLIWSNWCSAPISGGVVIHLMLGNNAGLMDIQTDIQSGGACNAPGYRSTVGISKLESTIPSP
jgi:hypothetical protein